MRSAIFFVLLIGPSPLYAQKQTADATSSATSAVVRHLEEDLDEYVFPERAKELQSFLKTHEKEYEKIVDAKKLAETLTVDLRRVGHDPHLTVQYSELSSEVDGPADASTKTMLHRIEEASGLGIRGVMRLPGNVGLLDLAYFSDDSESTSVLDGAMSMLQGTDAIIIDLRRNMGGNPIMVDRLLTYFFSKQVQLTSIRWRTSGRERIDEQWTLPFVPGQRMPDVPLFVLTSAHTFSAAEQCAYDLQVLHRARVIGETTGGGANPAASTHALGEHLEAFIPTGQALNPITNTNWEGVGVQPDVLVNADASLLEAFKQALRTAKPSISAPHLARSREKALVDPATALREAGFLTPATAGPRN